jgi:hypothetical protein
VEQIAVWVLKLVKLWLTLLAACGALFYGTKVVHAVRAWLQRRSRTRHPHRRHGDLRRYCGKPSTHIIRWPFEGISVIGCKEHLGLIQQQKISEGQTAILRELDPVAFPVSQRPPCWYEVSHISPGKVKTE